MWPPTVHHLWTVLTDCSLFPNAGKGSSQKRHAGIRFAEFIRNRRVIIDPYKTLLVSQRGFQRGETPLCRFGWGHAGTITTAFLSFVTPAQTSSLRADVRKQVQKRRKGFPSDFLSNVFGHSKTLVAYHGAFPWQKVVSHNGHKLPPWQWPNLLQTPTG